MNNIYNYLEFINEATLGIDKVKVDYQLSRPAREKAFIYSNSTDLESFNIKFEYTLESPDNTDDVLLIKPSSFLKINYLKLKEMEELNDGDFMVYKLISDDDINIKWAVAKIGQKTTVLKQFDRTGASKRGDYFRETAFLIRLAELTWINKGVKLKIYSNRGQIEMVYSKDKQDKPKASMSPRYNSKEFINTYNNFRKETHKDVLSTMDAHCEELIKHLGESITRVKYIIKNSSTNLINIMALNFMRQDAITKKRLAIETGFEFDIPANANISKWNPSDLWIVFDDRYFKSEKSYQNIDNIDQLNRFLYESLEGNSGVVGVSLKMSISKKKDTKEEDTGKYKHLYKITKDTRLVNRFKDFDISNNKKTAEIDFEFKNKLGEWKEGSAIDCRTFDTNNKSSISLEVKGKKGSGYVSGKAGSIIDYILPENYLNIKNILKKETSKETIRTALNIDFDKIENGYPGYKPAYLPENEKLKKVFLKDLEGDDPKNSNENSRLQSVVFFDWLLKLKEDRRNEVITTVVRYAKSESLWSAPHLALK